MSKKKKEKSKTKTLKQKNYEYQEVKDVLNQARCEANSFKIYSELKLKFLDWLENSGPHNTHKTWNSQKLDFDNRWIWNSWQKAIDLLMKDLKKEDFYVDIIANQNDFKFTVGLYPPKGI